MIKAPIALAALAISLTLSPSGSGKSNNSATPKPKTKPKTEALLGEGPAVLWRQPTDIASRDLYYGLGGKAHEPSGTFTFVAEAKNGSNPKFEVVDQNGVKWRVKLGAEARPETVATRFVWAVGYFANEDYFVPELRIQNMQRLDRGGRFVSKDGTARDARMKRHVKDEKKLGIWEWKHNPFTDSREWNGLRVMMALMNNWDLKDANNSVYQVRGERPEQRYVVSDLGASFGPTGLNWTQRGRLSAYRESDWITKTSSEYINCGTPAMPALNHWIGRRIPIADARWIGKLLAQLSPRQIRDAFRAGGYSPEDVEGFGQVVEERIGELNKL